MRSLQRTVSIATSAASSKEIPYSGYERGQVIIPAGSSITTLTWHVAEKVNGTFVPAYDSAASPAAVTQTVAAGRAYPIPAALAGAASLKAVGNVAGSVYVNLKG